MSGNLVDLIVVGEGLSGITAAAAAAGEGLHVMLVAKGPGSFVLGTGGIDLDGISDLGAAEYGTDEIEEATRFFSEFSAAAGCAFHGGPRARRLVPTIMGTFQTVSMAPRSLWRGDPRCPARVVVAGIESMPGFDADFVTERLSLHSRQMDRNTSYRSVVVRLPEDGRHALTAVEVANHIDRDPAYRSAVIGALRAIVQDGELLIMPGILGMKSGDEDLGHFEEEIGCPVCELSTMPPSVPGLRLLQRFERRLTELGVEICSGFSVQQLCLEGDRCTGILLDTPGRPRRIQADAVVLACGKFSKLLEGRTPQEVSRQTSAAHEALHLVSREGRTVAQNVLQCRQVLDRSELRHGSAIAILAGYRTGMLASKLGVQYATR